MKCYTSQHITGWNDRCNQNTRLTPAIERIISQSLSIRTNIFVLYSTCPLRSHPRHLTPAVRWLIGSAVHPPCKTHKHDCCCLARICTVRSRPSLDPPARSTTLASTPSKPLCHPDHSRRLLPAPAIPPTTASDAFAGPSQPDPRHHRCEVGTSNRGRPGCRSGRVLAATTTGHATWHSIRLSKATTTVDSPPMARPPLLPPSEMPLSPTSLAGRHHQGGVRQ
jgi:hypothetical protein